MVVRFIAFLFFYTNCKLRILTMFVVVVVYNLAVVTGKANTI